MLSKEILPISTRFIDQNPNRSNLKNAILRQPSQEEIADLLNRLRNLFMKYKHNYKQYIGQIENNHE